MKQVEGWWFGTTDKKLSHNDNREIVIGETHKISGDIVPCQHGLHLSKRIIDALNYAPGPVIYRVVGSGIIIPHGNPIDKYACSERTYVAGGVDISNTLLLFARKCALDVIHLWNPPNIVIKYLKTGDESIRGAAGAAAGDAARAVRDATERDAAWAAERAAAWDAAWSAAGAAARATAGATERAAWDAAWSAARATAGATERAAWDVAWSAAGAAWEKFNRCLTSMISRKINGGEG